MSSVAVWSWKFSRISTLAVIALAILFAALPEHASAQKAPTPLTKTDVIELLKNGVPSSRVETLVQERGISFEMTKAVEVQLREAGASESLLKTLQQLSTAATTTPPPPSEPPVLQIDVTPGGAQVYVDDALVGSASSQGRLILSQLSAGEHRVRLALPGYRDHEQNVTLAAGQTVNITATLEAAPPQRTTTGTTTSPSGQPPARSRVETFYVAHDHGKSGQVYCMGWLSVGAGKVEFRSISEPSHSFSYPLSAVKDFGKNDFYISDLGGFHIKIRNRKETINLIAVSASGQFQPPMPLIMAFRRALGIVR